MKLEPHSVGGERAARKPHPSDRSLPSVIHRSRPARVVEGDDIRGGLAILATMKPTRGKRIGYLLNRPVGCPSVDVRHSYPAARASTRRRELGRSALTPPCGPSPRREQPLASADDASARLDPVVGHALPIDRDAQIGDNFSSDRRGRKRRRSTIPRSSGICRGTFVLKKGPRARCEGFLARAKMHLNTCICLRKRRSARGARASALFRISIRGINVFKALQPLLYRGFALATLATV
jgi:hypothetical protein